MNKRIMILGTGSFAHSMMRILNDSGAETACYLTGEYGHYGAALQGKTWKASEFNSPLSCIEEFKPDLIIPMSIDWHDKEWAEELIDNSVPILSPEGEAIKLERDRLFAKKLCTEYGIKVPLSYFAETKSEAIAIVRDKPAAYVIKNPICSPSSPIHTIICRSPEETIRWLDKIDYADGVFLQEFLGSKEAGYFVFISNGEICNLVTNQEYKRAFTGNMGPVADAPLGGIVEQDQSDQYEIAESLIKPLLPWFKAVNYKGPLQVTAIFKDDIWYPIEYNVRLGATSGAMFLRMLHNPIEVLIDVAENRYPKPQWNENLKYGCSLTLAGHGYPYVIPASPKLPVIQDASASCDLWWNEVEQHDDQLFLSGHKVSGTGRRIADITACEPTLESAIDKVYENIRKIHCPRSYFRTDIGETLWPPKTGF